MTDKPHTTHFDTDVVPRFLEVDGLHPPGLDLWLSDLSDRLSRKLGYRVEATGLVMHNELHTTPEPDHFTIPASICVRFLKEKEAKQ